MLQDLSDGVAEVLEIVPITARKQQQQQKIGANGKQRASRPGLCKEERAGAGGHDGSHKYQAGPFIQRISAEFPMKWGWKKMPYLKLWCGTLCIEVILFHSLSSDACGLHHLVCVLNL